MREYEVKDPDNLFEGIKAMDLYMLLPHTQGGKMVLEDGKEVTLTPAFFEVMEALLQGSESTESVHLLSSGTLLTPEKAAQMLGVSRPFFYKLLDEGEFPWVEVGSHRRVLVSDVVLYQKNRVRRGKKASTTSSSISEKDVDVVSVVKSTKTSTIKNTDTLKKVKSKATKSKGPLMEEFMLDI